MQILGAIPFVKLQNDTKTTIKRWKTMKSEMEKKSSKHWTRKQHSSTKNR